MDFLPIRPVFRRCRDSGSAAPAVRTEASPWCRLTSRGQLALSCAQEDSMKIALSFLLATALICSAAPSSYAEPHQVMQGTQVHLTLLSGINSSVAKDGDPFVAVVAEPVYLGNQLLLPAGTRVNGIIPVQMSIIAIEQPHGQADGKRRKDVKVEEGQVVQQKHDIKGDIVGGAIGTGGGTLVGAVFSHAARGFGLGLAGGAAYIMVRKGKELELPPQTGMLIRMDKTITVPVTTAASNSYSGNR